MSLRDRLFGRGAGAAVEPLRMPLPATPAPSGAAAAEPLSPGDPLKPNLNRRAVSTPEELEWKRNIHEKLIKLLDFTRLAAMDEDLARPQIRATAEQVIADENLPVSAAGRQKLAKEVEDEIFGLGPLEPLMADPTVSDILVNGCHSVYVERYGKLEEVGLRFRDDVHLRHIIDRIVSRVGRRIDEFSPMVDARLPDGSRVNAVIPPLAIDGPLLSIRRFGTGWFGTDQLIRMGTITSVMAELLKAIVKARLNILISGGTGSGKTTILNVLSGFIPSDERIITIEDSAELQLQQPHVGRLETRPPNIEGQGQVTQRDLLRNALRMRPDRIIVGEVRQGEALDMLQAMNTGHDGSLTTVHANSPRDALARIENMVAMAGLDMPMSATRRQIASGIHVVVQMQRMEDGKRRMVSLQEIDGMEGETVRMSEIFAFRRTGMDATGGVLGYFHATGIVPTFQDRLTTRGIHLDTSLFDPNRRVE